MASTFFKLRHYAFLFVILSISLLYLITNYLFLTINYTKQLQDELHNLTMTTYLAAFHNSRAWFKFVPQDLNIEKLKIASLEMERVIRDGFHTRIKSNANVKNPEWFEVVAREFRDETFNIGLVNVGRAADGVRTTANMVKVDFDRVGEGVRWADMAPEKIDENSTCPGIPMPRFEDYRDLDVVVASVEHCRDGESKDVFRLQVNLVVANLLVRSGRKDDQPVYAVFVGGCSPMWEIFRCDDLLWNEGKSWVYKLDLTRIHKLMLMPFGPCQFVPPFSHSGGQDLWTKLSDDHITTHTKHQNRKEAYVTILHTSEDYVCGAIVLAQSILKSNTTKDLILLADDNISPQSIVALRSAGWQTNRIERIRSPHLKKNTYNEWIYSKLRIWRLTQYQKLIFVDANIVVNKNMDRFFAYPQLTAAGNYEKHLFNSGLMVVEPSRCAFETLMEKMAAVESYNGGDQGFLNEMFAWWHRLPAQTNYLKMFVDANDRLHYVSKKDVFAVHYTGLKPWKCEDEESDCNWDVPRFHRYASNSAHKMWWRVYKSMPQGLRDYCSLYRGKNNKDTSFIFPSEGPVEHKQGF